MSAVAIVSGVYRVENGALIRVRSFSDAADKCKCNSADRVRPHHDLRNASAFGSQLDKGHDKSAVPSGPTNVMTLDVAATDKSHGSSAARTGPINAMAVDASVADKVHELSAGRREPTKFMNFRRVP